MSKKTIAFFLKGMGYVMAGLFLVGWVWSLLLDILQGREGKVWPWTAWVLLFEGNAHDRAQAIFSFLLLAGFAGFLMVQYFKMRHLKTIYGDAHWATMVEIKKMGLLDHHDGLIIGEKGGRLLCAPLVSHALVFAPSRSGKGVSQVVPNALAFKESMLLIDVKDELFEYTSGFRHKHGQAVFSFAPQRLNQRTHCWNPLDLIERQTSRLITDVDLVGEILLKRSSSDNENSMWVDEARSLLKGLLLWLMDSDRPFCLGELVDFVKGTPDFVKHLKKIRDKALDRQGKVLIHPIAFTNINNFIEKTPKEQSGVKSTLTAKLNLWDDPLIKAATAVSDFDIRDMRKKPMTVYLGIPIDQLERLAPLMNLFIQLFLSKMTQKLPDPKKEPYKVLVCLDEFCALGKMNVLKNGFGFLAGFNVHLMAVIQNVGQFYDIYGGRDKSDVFFQNTDYKIAYRQNDLTDRKLVSELCGYRKVKIYAQSYRAKEGLKKSLSLTEAYTSKHLISADGVGRFPAKAGIALLNGENAIRYERIIYYKDPRFKNRVLPPMSVPLLPVEAMTLQVKKPLKSRVKVLKKATSKKAPKALKWEKQRALQEETLTKQKSKDLDLII